MLNLDLFRTVARLEGISFLFLLLVAMPLKYLAGQPQAVQVGGMVHGLLFIAYVLLVFMIRPKTNWSHSIVLLALVASVLPAGTLLFESKYLSDKRGS